jgi:hypothetical protein
MSVKIVRLLDSSTNLPIQSSQPFASFASAGFRQFRLLLLGEERVKDGCGGLLDDCE